MAIKLKTKVALGVGFLFLLLLLVGGVGFYYFNKISTESRVVLQENYKSVDYGRKMLDALNAWEKEQDSARKIFEHNLVAQENNITEMPCAGITPSSCSTTIPCPCNWRFKKISTASFSSIWMPSTKKTPCRNRQLKMPS
jgi:hypothetical protein